MSTAVEMALAKTVTVTPRSESAIKAEITKVTNERSGLLAVEADYKHALTERVRDLDDELAVLKAFPNGDIFPVLSSEVLRWRHGRSIKGVPVPTLALISLHVGNTAMMRFQHTEYGDKKLDGVPSQFLGHYRDVLDNMGRGDTRTESLVWTFRGVIPTAIRKKIAAHRNQFDDVLLLAEAPKDSWVHTRRRPTIAERMAAYDPIVVGYAARRLWVIDVFDPTPIETYILNEFTTKALPPA